MAQRKRYMTNVQKGILLFLGTLACITTVFFIEFLITMKKANENIDSSTQITEIISTETSYSTPTRNPTRTLIPSFTPTLTFTPRFSHTSSPSHTMELSLTPFICKSVVVSIGYEGGDGGDPEGYYFGFGMPSLTIYKDGQLIIRKRDNVYSKMLSTSQVNEFITYLNNVGFFIERDTIYDFPEDAEYSEGAPSTVLFANNGSKYKIIDIYYPYIKYLVPEIKTAYNYLTNYSPNNIKIYTPLQMVLWIEEGIGDEYSFVTPEPTIDWPEDLPAIIDLGLGHVVVDEKLITQFTPLFRKLPGGQAFKDGNKEYFIIARPLIPNESPSTKYASFYAFISGSY
jgi:hypothetical protein